MGEIVMIKVVLRYTTENSYSHRLLLDWELKQILVAWYSETCL